MSAAVEAGRSARAHLARLDADGGCVFVTLLHGNEPDPAGPARMAVAAAVTKVGGHLVGSRDEALEPYVGALKRVIDPLAILG